ncbi:hypothetical protein TrRE_jg109 [Triparma retinervis]|uniref:Prolyl 4-hydroxylase alpha subunit Fe(2+) 2OG dioxygenase domain-containing protein n=1 Tax=Triparma retinervis TaxID=2557542 RepID=A0A9W6ZQR1_9STRA|nr:hypothetical protein TrRE_jg109 [Triparma retinervis]
MTTTCSTRKYYYDFSGVVREVLESGIMGAMLGRMGLEESEWECVVLPGLRFLDYTSVGSSLPAHVDLPKAHPYHGLNSTHTIILYLADFEGGGETAMLKSVGGGEEAGNVVYMCKVRKGRALVFYHNHPHCGRMVEGVGKKILRGECYFRRREGGGTGGGGEDRCDKSGRLVV